MTDINFTAPLDEHGAEEVEGYAEGEVKRLVHLLFNKFFQENMTDLLNYGTPHLGSGKVIEQFAKKDGLAVLRREVTSDTILRVIYANWVSKGGKRGLNFLEFTLQMLWGREYTISEVYHNIEYAEYYPRFLSTQETEDQFLTSRRYITISNNISLKEVSELAPTLQHLIPANIVVKVLSEQANGSASLDLGFACVGQVFNVVSIE